jgi:hypothetical protein
MDTLAFGMIGISETVLLEAAAAGGRETAEGKRAEEANSMHSRPQAVQM